METGTFEQRKNMKLNKLTKDQEKKEEKKKWTNGNVKYC